MNSHHYVAVTLFSGLEIAFTSKNDQIKQNTSQFVLDFSKPHGLRGPFS